MLTIFGENGRDGAGLTRRALLRAGFLGLGGLSLSDLLRSRAAATAAGKPVNDTACILVWLYGGPSHLETYDLKPEAPAEYCGIFRPIATRVSGMEICELLPRQARVADKFVIIRSCSHNCAQHGDGTQQVLNGRPGVAIASGDPPVLYPSVGSIFKRIRPVGQDGLPSYVAIPKLARFVGPAYLGPSYAPFEVRTAPTDPHFQVPSLSVPIAEAPRLQDRLRLLRSFDNVRRDIDARGTMAPMDSYNQEALRLLTGDAAQRAFDISREPDRVRDRYGRTLLGQGLCLARRLVEAGVGFVHVQDNEFWDDHANQANIFDNMRRRLPVLDQAVAALIEDLYARGLDQRVLVIVTGEFGRTPKIMSTSGSVKTDYGRPGRDHWPSAMSMLVSGGGMRMGQVIGSTTAKGECPKDRPLHPTDLLATVYQFLGIDTRQEFLDHSGRPLAILPDGQPIRELLG